ncbi:MAG: hypothetical protein GFH27_549279n69 [Chloroflexi bacterium AL-W]|nr:hypothetical protein [Chloroflexi bacterium AL-N1]NOK72698.1 hypothetical protein [Chloroflexi bacterium AL-N5]NOK79214.1 hypothetical protein [Chloroflexi bacterium AL-W]NOK87130.1 hypothetical protein [Chloroflexi bacterium AL-N15]
MTDQLAASRAIADTIKKGGFMHSSSLTERAKIAVVNDDATYLALIRDILEECDYDVTVFITVDDAYQAICVYNPDLIIVDLLFPDSKHGVDLISMLWLNRNTRHIPIVVCSAATAELREMQSYLHSKNIGTLYKPFDLDELIHTVAHALQSKTLSAEPGIESHFPPTDPTM